MRWALATLLAITAGACGGSGDDTGGGAAGSGGSSSGGGGSSGSDGGGGSSSGSGGTGATDASSDAADSGECAALKADMEVKLAQAQSCYAGTPNPSSCEIVQDAICNCVAVQSGYAQAYLDAAKAYKAAGCPYTCSAAPCPTSAMCKAAGGSTQGACAPSG